MTPLIVFGMGAIIAWSIVSDRLRRWHISGPLTMIVLGVVVGSFMIDQIGSHLDTELAERIVELILAVLLFVWWLVTELEVWSELFVPRPEAVWARFVDSVTVHDGQKGLSGYYLWEHLGASLRRIGLGVGLATLELGIPLGLLLATVRPFQVIVEPYVNFIRALPPLAYFSLLIIWFGIEDASKVWLLFLAAFAPIAIGLALTLIHLISIPVTNTSVNPARSTGVAVFASGAQMAQLWLFWLAPIVGGVLGGLLYKWLGHDRPDIVGNG